MEGRHSYLQSLILITVAGLLFFARIDCALQEPEEPRYAEIPRQMLDSGNFTVPYYHGLPYYDKPPLLYWLVMGCYALFGVHDWAAKLVPSSAGFLTVLIAYLWGRKVAGQRAGFAGAMMLCLSGRFVYLGRLLTMNSLLCLCVVATLTAGHLAVRGPRLRWRWWCVSALACALGLLSKGPVALILAQVPLVAFQVLERGAVRPRLLPWTAYVALAIGPAFPWYLQLAWAEQGFLGYFFVKHNLLRYVSPFDHVKPVWFYFPEVGLGMLPWSLLLVPLVKQGFRRMLPSTEPWPAGLRFSLLAFVWCFVFFSFSGSKRAGYILPAMPFLAMALGNYLDWMLCQAGKLNTYASKAAAGWAWCSAATIALLLAAVLVFLPGYAGRFSMRGQLESAAEASRAHHGLVVCYPRRWDSVSFYLQRNDMRIYTRAEEQKLLNDLETSPRTLAFIKSDRFLPEFLQVLPASLEFVPLGRPGQVAVGWVQPRREAVSPQLAGPVDEAPPIEAQFLLK